MDFFQSLFTIVWHASSERSVCFLMSAKRGKPDRKKDFVICKQNILQKIKKFHSPIIQESGGGKCPPLAGIRKPLAESGACQKMENRKSTANVEEPLKICDSNFHVKIFQLG
jgi:hypothetical protein